MRLVIQAILFTFFTLLAFNATAFRNTQVESSTDPDFEAYRPVRILVLIENVPEEARKEAHRRLVKAFSRANIAVQSYADVFPESRHWDYAERQARLKAHNIDSVLAVTGGESLLTWFPIANRSIPNSSAYATTRTYSGQGAPKVTGARSRAKFRAVLYNTAEDRIVWSASVITKASGTLFVSEKGNGKGGAIGIIRALKRDRHLRK